MSAAVIEPLTSAAAGLGVEVKENGWAADVTDPRESTPRNLSVRFTLMAGVAGSAGALGPLMMGDMAGGR